MSALGGIPRVRAVAMALLLVGGAGACGREPVGPAGGTARAAIRLEPLFQTSSDPTSDVSVIRVSVYAVNTALPPGSANRRKELRAYKFDEKNAQGVVETDNTVTVVVEFPLLGGNTVYEVDGGAYNSAGVKLYDVPPVQFSEQQLTTGKVTVNATAVYVGPGATAVKILITPRSLSMRPGESATLSATAFDAAGKEVTGAPIRWRSSNGTVASIANDRQGLVTANAPGAATITATIEALNISDGIPVTVALTPSALLLVSGGGQSAVAGTALANPVVVRVMAGSTPVPGVTVGFALTGSGSGSLSASAATTDASGQAQVRWTLGATVGTQTLVASVPGVPSLTITATATAPPVPPFSVSMQLPASTIATGASLTATIQVTSNGTPVAGVQVALAPTATAGGFTSSSVVTNSSGQATAVFTASTPGAYTLSATATNSAGVASVATATVTVVNPSTVTQLVKVSGDGQTVRAGSLFGAPVVVEARNGLGQPVSGAALDFSTISTPVRLTTGPDGRASVLYTAPLAVGVGTITVSLVSNPSISVTFSYTVIP